MSACEQEAVLKESTTSTFKEEVSEFMTTCTWGIKNLEWLFQGMRRSNYTVWQFCGQQIVSAIADDMANSSTYEVKPMLITGN
eukprot:14691090-Ditylum_brightwellii.AAC.1